MAADVYGMAFKDYLEGKFLAEILVHSENYETEAIPVSWYFRNFDLMPVLERLALEQCRGKILDTGAGAGSHSLELQKRGADVTAIDLSPGAVKVIQQRGVKKAVCSDFFSFNEPGFDCLLMMMNGIGIAGSLKGLGKLLDHAHKLLNASGRIIFESSDLIYIYEEDDGSYAIPMMDNYYGEVRYQLEYAGRKGSPFSWVFVDFDNISDYARRHGFQARLLYRGNHFDYLAELVKT
jgi:SAM-dependent methyltransferase